VGAARASAAGRRSESSANDLLVWQFCDDAPQCLVQRPVYEWPTASLIYVGVPIFTDGFSAIEPLTIDFA
jgi:hypothetical protein